jgi:uncharacterized protein (TIGR02611 family)
MTVTDERPESAADDDRPGFYRRLHARLHANPVTGLVTKIVVTIVGVGVILVGVVLSGPGIPGPGLLVIVAGLAILATEWEWAERLLKRAKRWLERQRDKARAMDPAVRRRRIALILVATIVLAAAALAYVWYYDWPSFAVSSWNRIQSFHDAVPELPGM